MATHILIRHMAGSKINQVEQFPIESFPELGIGREPGSTILFDSPHDDAVSRKHAVITAQVTPAIAEMVKRQVETGIDCIGDGEF